MKTKFLFLTALLFALSFIQFSNAENADTKRLSVQDKIFFSKQSGSTRSASATEIEGHSDGNLMTIFVQNYRGGVWVQLYGGRTARQSYFYAFGIGFEVINIAGLRAGTYTVRLTLDNEVYEGTFTKRSNGR